ncbi:MAG: M50 family metallopeptidase [Solirubrobacterales bacterium]
MSWFYAFLAFAALIVLHEFGHFIAAKAVGMRVEKFSLFFPPAVVKHQRGETSYQIGAIPLGGYVKITGMNPEEEIEPEYLPRAYFMQPVWKRVVTIAAGPAMNILIAFILIFILYAMVGTSVSTTNIREVSPDSPAAGKLQPGDRMVSVNGVRGDAATMVQELGKSKCVGKPTQGCAAGEPVKVTIERDGDVSTFITTPHYDAKYKRMRIGLTFASVAKTVPPGQALSDTMTGMWNVTRQTVTLPARIIDAQKRKEIHGTAGSYDLTQKAFKSSTEETIGIIALISLSLALINLFPFLPLDGGHIFWALAEKVRGRPIPVPVLERASMVGIALIAVLVVIGFTNDLNSFQNGGFGP